MGKSGIPDRWLPYSPMGSVVPGTCFIACKVPLNDALLRKLPANQRFGPKELMKSYPKLGLLIDLTNTTRYYMKEDFTTEGIQYKKIFCPGHVIPPNSIVKEFNNAVDTFLAEFKETDVLIAVHCTHGVNRTGYFICRYMIEKMNIPPEEAVKRFQQARGHKIERQPYVDDLKNGCKGGSESHASFKNNINQMEHRFGRKRCIQECEKYSNMNERISRTDKLNYNWRDRHNTTKRSKNELSILDREEKPSMSSKGRNNHYRDELFTKSNGFKFAHYQTEQPWFHNSHLGSNGSSHFNSQQSLCQSLQNSSLTADKLKSESFHRDVTKSKSFDKEPKSFHPHGESIPLDSCQGYKTNYEDCNGGVSANYWKSTHPRHHTNRPNHHQHPFNAQRPPLNAFCIARPPNHQAGLQRPPPPPHHAYQSHNRVWRRSIQQNTGSISKKTPTT